MASPVPLPTGGALELLSERFAFPLATKALKCDTLNPTMVSPASQVMFVHSPVRLQSRPWLR